MRDLLKRRPSAAELTGITESRFGCFAASVRAYLAGPASTSARPCVSGSPALSTASTSNNQNPIENSLSTLKLLPLPRHRSSRQASSGSGSLSLRTVMEKLKKQVESSSSSSSSLFTAPENSKVVVMTETSSNSDLYGCSEAAQESKSCPSFLESLSKLTISPRKNQPVLSPYYCWCPPTPSNESPSPSSHPALSFSDLPTLDFPDPFPLLDLPKPTSTFTPLMCDPIVHIPVIDVCFAAGQGYIVSAGTTIPPMHAKLNSAAEEGARGTLWFLLGGSSAFASSAGGGEKMELVGSRGLYSGTLLELD